MRLIHYSSGRITSVMETKQGDPLDSAGAKPNGLWLSVAGEDGNDSWKEYCCTAGAVLKPFVIEVVLQPNARILWLSDAATIDALTQHHALRKSGYFLDDCPDERMTRQTICGKSVAQRYDGVLAAPFCSERNHPKHWYSYWCCASGCIWHPRAVSELRPLS